MTREKLGRNASSAFLIVDAQSVKNTDTAALKGYDAGKKVSGIKRASDFPRVAGFFFPRANIGFGPLG